MNKFIVIVSFFILILKDYKAQVPLCHVDSTELVFIKKNPFNFSKISSPIDSSLSCLPLNICLIGKSDSTDLLLISKLNRDIDTVNKYFKNAGIQFYMLPIIYVYNDTLSNNLSYSEQVYLSNLYSLPNVINLFFQRD